MLAEGIGRNFGAFRYVHLCRGMSNADWYPVPSLLRSAGPKAGDSAELLRLEADARRLYQESAALWPETRLPVDKTDADIDWWAVMQHHGAPTRLLDWTASIYVAAFFAVESDWNLDGALWYFTPVEVAKYVAEQRKLLIGSGEINEKDWPRFEKIEDQLLLSADAPHLVVPSGPSQHWAPRMVAQQGNFTVGVNVAADHMAAIEEAHVSRGRAGDISFWCKVTIPAALKPHFAQQLLAMNVTPASLFPNADGFARSIALRTRLAAVL